MNKISTQELTALFDNYLIVTGKTEMTLRTANELLKSKEEFKDINLKNVLESRGLEQAYQTEISPRQWYIKFSEPDKYRELRKKHLSDNKPQTKTTTKIKKSTSIQDIDQQTFNKKHGWKLWLVLIILVLIGYCSQDPAERNADKEKKKLESKFNSWDGSHIKLVEYTKQRLRDPDSFEHIETTYMDKGNNVVFVTMQFRSKNGFGGYNVSTAFANCNKSTGEVIECDIIDN